MHSDWPRGVFAWEYANMVVTSSRCFPFRVLITQAQIWTVFELKTRQVYFIYPWFPRWLKLGKASQTSCVKQSIFHLSWHFKEEKSVFWKAFFLQNKNFMRASLHVHDFATGNNFSCISTMTCKQFCVFSR